MNIQPIWNVNMIYNKKVPFDAWGRQTLRVLHGTVGPVTSI